MDLNEGTEQALILWLPIWTRDSPSSRFLPLEFVPLLLVDTDHPIEEAQSGRFVPLERIPPDN